MLHRRACRTCAAPIYWAINKSTHKAAPIDVIASPDGNCRLDYDEEEYDVLAGEALAAARAEGVRLHTSHFQTCPDAQAFRRR